MAGSGSSTLSYTANQAFIQDAISLDSNPANFKIDIFDYATTDRHKSCLARMDAAFNGTTASATRFASTAAITSITLVPNGVNFTSGSTFSLYGVSA